MNYEELKTGVFGELLEEGEELLCSFHGILIQKHWNPFCFFALTDTCLLICSLPDSNKERHCFYRIPLDIKNVEIKKCFFPGQYIINIEFNNNDLYCIRASKKLFSDNFDFQEKNLTEFLDYMSSYVH